MEINTKSEFEDISTRVVRIEKEIDNSLGIPLFSKPESFDPYWGWKDDAGFELVFNGRGNEEEEYFYSFECIICSDNSLHFIFDKMYEDDHVDAAGDFTDEQFRLFKQLITTLMAYDKGGEWLKEIQKGRKCNNGETKQDEETASSGEDLRKFKAEFDRAYSFLYDSDNNVPEYKDLISLGESFLSDKANKQFLADFAKLRSDLISSDRECAALAMALHLDLDK